MLRSLLSRVRVGLAASCIGLALAGCATLGPDYREPDIEWLAGWQPDLYGQLDSENGSDSADLQFWWRTFDDPVLDNLIETARTENPSLRIAGLRILESRAVLGIARSALYPQARQVTGEAAAVHSRQDGGATGDGSNSFATYQAGLAVGWELDFWGRFRRGVESADSAFFASVTNQHDVQVLLAAQVAEAYFAYRTTRVRMDIARKNAELQKRSFEITRQLFEKGQSAELDLQQAKTQYLATLSTIPDLEIAMVQSRNALCALLGRPPGALPELAGAEESVPTLEPALIGQIPAKLLMRRPDVRAAAWQVAAQSAQIGIAESDLYPAISLFGSVGWSGSTISGSPDTTTLAAGPALTWNVFDQGLIRNNVRIQDARLQQAIEAYQATVLQAAREIDDAAIAVVRTRDQLKILGESVHAAERSLELANRRYQEGYANFQRVLDAQRALAAQADREIVNKGRHVSAIVSLYKAIGGGWQPQAIDAIIPEDTRETMQSRTNWGDLLTAPLPAVPDNPSTGLGTPP